MRVGRRPDIATESIGVSLDIYLDVVFASESELLLRRSCFAMPTFMVIRLQCHVGAARPNLRQWEVWASVICWRAMIYRGRPVERRDYACVCWGWRG